jgi:GNAT superfamily N-acetyltransferase
VDRGLRDRSGTGNAVQAIRTALSHDLADVEAVVMRAYRPYVDRLGREPGPMKDDYAAMIAAGSVTVLDRDGIIAVLVLLPEEDTMLLDNIAVDPAHHGTGCGRLLLAFAEDEARSAGFGTIRLYTHERMTENIAIYAKLGYVETHRAVENGFPRVYMAKAL